MASQGRRTPRLLPRRVALLLALLVAIRAGGGTPAVAQELSPIRPLHRVSTAHFDLYYPASLEAEAGRLAGLAEGVREGLLGPLGLSATSRDDRFPVLLTDELAETNGSFAPAPSPRIVLRMAPPLVAEDLGAFPDPLVSLFRHELVHALSTSPRGGLPRGLAALGGDGGLGMALLPESFLEGVAVMAEGGLDPTGKGRLQDAGFTAYVREDLLEGKAPDFWAAAGARDDYPHGNRYYAYGGAFNAWLRGRYGATAYAAFWDRAAGLEGLVGEGPAFQKGPFQAAFGLDLKTAWEDFIAETAAALPRVGPAQPLVAAAGLVTALTADPRTGTVYWVDAYRGRLLALGPGETKPRILGEADGHVVRLSFDAATGTILASTALMEDGREILGTLRFNLDTRSWNPGFLRGIREAWPLGHEDLLGIACRGLDTDLVVAGPMGRTVLLAGRPGFALGSPVAAGGRIYCLAAIRGRRVILRLPPPGGDGSPEVLDLPGEDLDYLSSDGRKLAIALARSGDLYRAAILDPEDSTLRAMDLPPLGAVHEPVLAGDRGLIHIGRFSEGEKPCREDPGTFSPLPGAAAWMPLAEYLGSSGSPPDAASDENATPAPLDGAMAEKAFLPLLLASSRRPSLDLADSAAGLTFQGQALGGGLSWGAATAYAWEVEAFDLGLELQGYLGPWTLGLSLGDGFAAANSAWYRVSQASALVEVSLYGQPRRRRLDLGLLAGAAAQGQVTAGEAYAGSPNLVLLAGRLFATGQDLQYVAQPPQDSRGWTLTAWADGEALLGEAPVAAFGLALGFSLPEAGLQASLGAEASPFDAYRSGPGGRYLHGSSGWLPSALGSPLGVYAEYESAGLAGGFYAFGEASARLVDLEVQANLAGLVHLRRAGLRAGLRGAWLAPATDPFGAGLPLASAWARLSLEATPLLGYYASLGFEGRLEARYAFMEAASPAGPWGLELSAVVRL